MNQDKNTYTNNISGLTEKLTAQEAGQRNFVNSRVNSVSRWLPTEATTRPLTEAELTELWEVK